jgi:hypothetical protein
LVEKELRMNLLIVLIGALILLAAVACWGSCWLGAERERSRQIPEDKFHSL